jgi:2-polyprenyl-3-methyl-5-hydroxy-6-metoxy-1,4-benzoquinol methylase
MKRVDQAEWMDDPGADRADFDAALRDLAFLARWSLGYRPTLGYLDRLVARTGVKRLSILDVGAGGGDMLRALAAWGKRRGIELTLTGLDRSPWAEQHARAAGTPGAWLTTDLFALPEDATYDVITCALFAHHLNQAELRRFLHVLQAHARLGWVISDLHRHRISWLGLWVLTRALHLAPMVINDSTISVARAATGPEWRAALADAGVAAELRWCFPFRWLVTPPP